MVECFVFLRPLGLRLIADGPQHHTPQSGSWYLDEYINQDPRVSHLLAGAETLAQSACSISIDAGPVRVARQGFLSLGDAATPAGHVGVLPAMYLGRKAALIAAEALDMNDLSARRLNMYAHLFHSKVLHIMRSESELMLALTTLPDAELDRLAHVLSGLPMAAPFFGGWQGVSWEAARWLERHYPEGTYRSDLLQRILDGSQAPFNRHAWQLPGMWSLPLGSDASALS